MHLKYLYSLASNQNFEPYFNVYATFVKTLQLSSRYSWATETCRFKRLHFVNSSLQHFMHNYIVVKIYLNDDGPN